MPLTVARFDLFPVRSDETLLPAHPGLIQKIARLCVGVWWRELGLVRGRHCSLTWAVKRGVPVTTFSILKSDIGRGGAGLLCVIWTRRR